MLELLESKVLSTDDGIARVLPAAAWLRGADYL
jgi:hypothetical protein